ncbi:hypothetical protein Zmor_018957 [Zophobas morio]|uniref:Elongator complex protein 1 n=1 Tax=Zophobas morio TaxID=2755281 RepID=A0AA38IFP4_9CUCU|nr:hypothetical protein Zmor_018957 [Zophobas morio]
MKNLELLQLFHKPVDDTFAPSTIFAQTGDTTYFIKNTTLYKHDFIKNTTLEVCPHNFEDATHLKVLTIENKICIVTKDSIHIFDPEEHQELQTLAFDSDIAAISWNPTEEIVALVSQSGDVATYSIDYINGEVFPQGQSSVQAKIPDTVYVGWGSKDTQFRGSEGKLKKTTPVETKPVKDKKPTISWRGNGEMFVVNYWESEKRKFVVFETPCKALYRSEECPGLQPPVAWRPTGNMIATVAESSSQSIVIFEKNGQKRFSFDLNFGTVRIKELKWSPCAQILTICTEDSVTNTQNIHLLTSSNYKWYEKQKLTFRRDNPLLDFDWLDSTQFTYTLRVVTVKEIVKYVFRSVINNSLGVCGVIDGKSLQLTDFTDSVIPPIMSLKTFTNSAPINFVAFGQNCVVIVDCDNNLKILDIETLENVTSVNLKLTLDNLSLIPLSCHHFIHTPGTIFFSCETPSDTIIHNLDVATTEIKFINAAPTPLRHLVHISTNHDLVSLSRLDSNLYINDCQDTVRQDVKIINDKPYTCRLLSNCHFYVNDHKISDCVNSFQIFDNYLLYTTKLNELYCLRLTGNFDNKYLRSVEQGATIVTAITNSPKIVLQLPRGNLETISCRLISIDILDRLLDDGRWDEALRFIRLEKLNANLLFDLDANRFLEQIDRFMTGAKTINELNSICLEFEEGNVLDSIYRNWGKSKMYPGKIDAIFLAIFKYFNKVDYADYITTILIINLNFFTLREGLVYLQDLLRRSYGDVTLKKKLIEAINTLKTYGCDQEKLYTESLLLYDLDLAHFVATCCQMDPRVYEPQINTLRNLREVERRFQINVFAKNPRSAVNYLLRCPDIESEVVSNYIKNNNVSLEAYETCPRNNRQFEVVSRAFAEDMSRRGFHQEAGLVLKRAGLLKEALDEFMLCLNWREVVNVLGELKVNEVERVRVISELAWRLTQGHVQDAAMLYEFYVGSYEMAIKVLLEAELFKEAVHVAKKHNRRDIIVSEVVPLVQKQKIYLEEKLKDLSALYDKYRLRLVEVRRNKLNKFSNFGDECDDRDDLFSDAGSTITKTSRSSRSRSSTASSRNRRKEEKKKQDLREGGIYEDIALIRALHCTIKEIYNKGEDVRNCCILLLQESDSSFKEVKKLYDLYWKVDGHVKNGVGEIWPPHFTAYYQTQDVQELADLENFEHLDGAYRTAPDSPNWKLNFFKK